MTNGVKVWGLKEGGNKPKESMECLRDTTKVHRLAASNMAK
jgi:hypothetical protein